jgi:hypothetical protein
MTGLDLIWLALLLGDCKAGLLRRLIQPCRRKKISINGVIVSYSKNFTSTPMKLENNKQRNI